MPIFWTPLFLEKWWPYAAGTLAAVLYVTFWSAVHPPKTAINLLAAVVSVAGIAVGFLAAAGAIIVSIDDSKIIKGLRETGFYTVFLSYLHSAVTWSFVLACISAVGLLRDFENSHWPWFAIGLWVFTLVTATCCYYRVVRAFSVILSKHS